MQGRNKSTFSKCSFGSEGSQKKYSVYASDHVDNYGRPLRISNRVATLTPESGTYEELRENKYSNIYMYLYININAKTRRYIRLRHDGGLNSRH